VNTASRFPQFLLILLMASPLVPILAAWWKLVAIPAGRGRQYRALLVCLLSTSWILILASALSSDFFGPNYSNRRYAIIYSNWLVSVVCIFLASRLTEDKSRVPILFSACLLTLIWSLDAALNAAV
jgi:hypothetical protein